MIYLPEVAFDKEAFLDDVSRLLKQRDNVVVAVSEGIRDRDGNYISASDEKDIFGHSQLTGAGKALELLVKEKLGVKVRSVEINILQRCAAHLASLTDINEAYELGRRAVLCAETGKTAVMTTLERVKSQSGDYDVLYGDTPVEYLRPLIQGEVQIPYQDGLPQYADISHLYEE